ncbi:GNAT family N-acetyltransferase [Fluviispira vulneris]|uniref:GNAT family N-acetyltransferase n=1 Tax=Fluviispira vulneris TaxID=2763012 RepID=UPI00164929ED|nr:GNAT family protein [Fluviispira vulneris]
MIQFESIYLMPIEEKYLKILQIWRNNSEFRQYFREYKELNYDDQQRWLNKINSENSNNLMFGVFDSLTKELIGVCGLCNINFIYRNAELSMYIGINNLYIDDVYAPDVATALIRYAYFDLNLERIWCEVYEIDIKKSKLIEKIGFKKEGILRNNVFKNGKYLNSIIYGVIRSELELILSDSNDKIYKIND